MQQQQQQQHVQQQQNKQKRKRESGNGSDGSETGSEGPDDGLHGGMGYGNNPAQRMGAIHSLLASLSDPAEIEAAEKVLESKRISMGGEGGIPLLPQLGGGAQPSAENTWQVLQQVFSQKGGEAEAKRRKAAGGMAGNKSAVEAAAAAAAAAGPLAGLDPTMIHGLTQVFAKHPEYLKEINKNLQQS